MPNPDNRVPGFGSSQTREPGLGKNPPGLDSLDSVYIYAKLWSKQ